MMPSRGLSALRSIAPRSMQVQSRNYSIARATPLRSSLQATSLPRAFRQTSIAAATSHAIRHNSTTATRTNLPNIDTLTLDQIDFADTGINATERIGYLKDIGLDFGWGPSATIQWVMEHIHIWGDLPWWGSIMATAVVFRTMIIPLIIRAQESNARMHAMSPVLKPITEEIKEAQRAGDKQKQQEAMMRMMAVRKQANIKISHTFMPAIVQGVIGYCGFKVIGAMCQLPVPGMQTGGFLWISDLTLSDGYLILPAIFATVLSVTIKIGGDNGGMNTMQNKNLKYLLQYGLPGFAFLITGWQAAGLVLWFSTTATFSLAQAALLRRDAIRRQIGLSPLVRPKPGEAVSTGSLEELWNQYTNAGGKKETQEAPKWQAPSFAKPAIKVVDTTLVKKTGKKSYSTAAMSQRSVEDVVDEVRSTIENSRGASQPQTIKTLQKQLAKAQHRP